MGTFRKLDVCGRNGRAVRERWRFGGITGMMVLKDAGRGADGGLPGGLRLYAYAALLLSQMSCLALWNGRLPFPGHDEWPIDGGEQVGHLLPLGGGGSTRVSSVSRILLLSVVCTVAAT